jgi:hypothetical protein
MVNLLGGDSDGLIVAKTLPVNGFDEKYLNGGKSQFAEIFP